MSGTIVVSTLVSATTADILQGTRLQSAPANGVVSFSMQAADGVAANHYTATIQLPSGDTPMNGVWVPAGEIAGLAGVLDDRQMLAIQVPVAQGGHIVFTVTETGDTELIYRVVFRPV